MKRREFVAGLSSAVVCAGSAHAQAPAVRAVGFLRSTPAAGFEQLADAFRDGLRDSGFVEGRNVRIEYRFSDDQEERLRAHARDLIGRQVAVLVGDSLAVMAAQTLQSGTPMVFATGGDPVRNGLVASLSRPGGSITGVTFFGGELGPKRLELLHQIAPAATPIAMLAIPNNPTSEGERTDVRAAALKIGQEVTVLDVASDSDLDAAFSRIVQHGSRALLVGAGTFLNSRRQAIVAFAARHKLPAVYSQREAVLGGGLMSYGTSVTDAYRQLGMYAARILNGEKPADLPVVQNVKFELMINTKTAKALGLAIPPSVLALADEVIE